MTPGLVLRPPVQPALPARAAPDAPRGTAITYGTYDLFHVGHVRLFRRITEDFADSANAWDSLAEGQIAAGDKAGARKSYQRVLQLLPDDAHAQEQLETLQ